MKKKIISLLNIKKELKILRKEKKRIVHCHGVFDLLHIGHLKHFESAKKFGDILVVSITPDKFVQKGFNRPYFRAEQRMEILASIEVVDFVVLNNSKNAVDAIKKIKPNYYCKGPDYKNFKEDITGQIKNELEAVRSELRTLKNEHKRTTHEEAPDKWGAPLDFPPELGKVTPRRPKW